MCFDYTHTHIYFSSQEGFHSGNYNIIILDLYQFTGFYGSRSLSIERVKTTTVDFSHIDLGSSFSNLEDFNLTS